MYRHITLDSTPSWRQKWFRASYHAPEDDSSLLGYWPLTMPVEYVDGKLVPARNMVF